MLVFDLFVKKLETLSLLKRKVLLGKIFNLEVVYLYSCEMEDDMVVIKLYDGSYYRFRFIFDMGMDDNFFKIKLSSMYNYIDINVQKFKENLDIFDDNNKFVYLIKLFAEENKSYLNDIFKG